MTELKLNNGLKTYIIKGDNGECQIRFNPTDGGLVERMYDTIERLETVTNNKQTAWEAETEPRERLALMRELDEHIRTEIDALFGAPVSQAVCNDVRIYALSDGLPIWLNIILAVIDEMDASAKTGFDRGNQRLNKYKAKYNQPQHNRNRKRHR